ncbi:MAG TPA: putative Ig domain-containing protein, partial [Verrucomicrobiota bacterium]|nr:putative Ig domain-containing protein [Verrucomicrobiota bacterium]
MAIPIQIQAEVLGRMVDWSSSLTLPDVANQQPSTPKRDGATRTVGTQFRNPSIIDVTKALLSRPLLSAKGDHGVLHLAKALEPKRSGDPRSKSQLDRLPVVGQHGEPFSDAAFRATIKKEPLDDGRYRILISYETDTNRQYVLEYRDDLAARSSCDLWRQVPGAPHNAGFLADTNDLPMRFYRLRLLDEPQSGLFALLINDNGNDADDGLTSDPSVTGQVTLTGADHRLEVSLDRIDGPYHTVLQPLLVAHHFQLTSELLAELNGGPLADGPHTLYLQVTDVVGTPLRSHEVSFNLDTTPPSLNIDLDPISDSLPTGDRQTTAAAVTLTGRSEPGTRVTLIPPGFEAVSREDGTFEFTNVILILGTNSFAAIAQDPQCNETVVPLEVVRLPVCPFPDGLPGWILSATPPAPGEPSGSVVARDCSVILFEGGSFHVSLSAELEIPAVPALLELVFEAPSFDTTSSGLSRDAFEVALTDLQGRPVGYTIQGANQTEPPTSKRGAGLPPRPPACFNWTEGYEPSAAPGTSLAATGSEANLYRLAVGLQGLAPGSAARLHVCLLNNDGDRGGQLTLRNLSFIGPDASLSLAGQSTPALSPIEATDRSLDDANCLSDATALTFLPESGPVFPTTTCIDAPAGLVAWWGGVMEQDGIGTNEPVLVGGVQIAAEGKPGPAFRCTEGGSVDVGQFTRLDGASEMTVAAWVLQEASGYLRSIVSQWGYYYLTNNRFMLFTTNTTDQLPAPALFVRFDDDSEGAVAGVKALPMGEWTHLAASWKSSDGLLSLYVNGKLSATNYQGAGKRLSSGPTPNAKIGDWNDVPGGTRRFPGVIDEVLLLDRALSPEDVSRLWAAGADGKGFCQPGAPELLMPSTSLGTVVLPGPLVISGRARAQEHSGLFNGIAAVEIAGQPAESLDLSGNFFSTVQIVPGYNDIEVVALDNDGRGTTNIVTVLGSACANGYATLADLTGTVLPRHGRQSFDPDSNLLYEELSLLNVGSKELFGPAWVAVQEISEPTVSVVSPDGVTRAGQTYYDFGSTLNGGRLIPGGVSAARTIAFHNPLRLPFTYSVAVLANQRSAPRFTSVPTIQATVGRDYEYHAVATDTFGGALRFEALSLPTAANFDASTGRLRWIPDTTGSFEVRIRVRNEDGDSAEQSYVVHVADAQPNRPPAFVSTPVTVARARAGSSEIAYSYHAQAVDPDANAISYSLGEGNPAGLTVDRLSGLVQWSPSETELGEQQITLQASDGNGGVAEQRFTICVLPSLTAPTFPLAQVDLSVQQIDTRGVVTDGQTLLISGTVAAWIQNKGTSPAAESFEVLFFEDRDHNGQFDALNDLALARATNTMTIQPGTAARITGSVLGPVQFAGSPISVYVDSLKRIMELNETNNVLSSHNECVRGALPRSFDPVVKWIKDRFEVEPSSDQVMMTPAVIDLDRDGIPEIIFTTYSGRGYGADGILRVVSGIDGSENFSVTDPKYRIHPSTAIAVGDLDGDGAPEIVAVDENFQVLAFDNQGRFRWRADKAWNWNLAPSIADIDSDGHPEILVSGMLLNFDGSLRWDRTSVGQHGSDSLNGFGHSIIADLDSDGILELIGGTTAYRANGDPHFINDGLGLNAIGDFDLDGLPEIVMVNGSDEVRLIEHTGALRWTAVSTNSPVSGPPLIADFDGDGFPEIGTAGRSNYIVLDRFGRTLWTNNIVDVSSGMAGSTAFDFDGDGATEIVYGDEKYLYVFRGKDGEVMFKTEKPSETLVELPIVADIDGDGSAEIVAVANDGKSDVKMHGIVVVGDRNNNWAATRSIWNQHSYHISNINDDGSIPRHEPRGWQLYNTYRVNAFPPLPEGTLAPDLLPSFVRVNKRGEARELLVRIGNAGSAGSPSGISVAAFAGDPRREGGLLGVGQITTPIKVGEFTDVVVPLTDPGIGDIWVVVDNDGSGRTRVDTCQKENDFYKTGLISPLAVAPPVFSSEPVTLAQEELAYIYHPKVENPTGTLEFGLLHAPSGMTIDSSSGKIHWVPRRDQGGAHIVELSATNDDGSRAVQIFQIVVEDQVNVPPRFESSAPSTARFGEVYLYQPLMADDDGDSLTLELPVAPEGMRIDAASGRIAWRPQVDQLGSHDVVIQAADGRGGVAAQSFTVEVRGANRPPAFVEAPPVFATAGTPYSYQLKAYDPEGDTLWFYVTNAPQYFGPQWSFVVETNGVIDWTPILNVAGTNRLEFVVADSEGAMATETFTFIVQASGRNDPPNFVSEPRVQTRFGVPWIYLARAEDPDAGRLTIRLRSGPIDMGITNQVIAADGTTWQAPLNGTFVVWTPSRDAIGQHEVVLEVSDGSGSRRTQSFQLTVANTLQNGPPRITSLPPSMGSVDGLFTYAVEAADPDHDLLAWRLREAPMGARIDSENGTIRWIPTGEQVGVARFVVEVTDGLLGVERQVFEVKITCANAAPFITSFPSVSVSEGELYHYAPRAIDPEGNLLEWTLIESPPDSWIDSKSGLFRWNVPQGAAGSYPIRLGVSDYHGGYNAQSFNLQVLDTRANQSPIITSQPISRTTSGREYRYLLTASDADQDSLEATLVRGPDRARLIPVVSQPGLLKSELSWTPDPTTNGPFDFTIQVTDSRNGESVQRFFVTARTNSAPTVASIPFTNAIPGQSYRYALRANDANGDPLSMRLVNAPDGMVLDQNGLIRWTPTEEQLGDFMVVAEVDDGYGGITRKEFTIAVRPDTTPPLVALSFVSGGWRGEWSGLLGE